MPLTPEQQAEVESVSRAAAQATRRATVPALEEILYQPLTVLDHGFVRVVDYMGDDAAIVQAARVSYGKGTRKVSEDRGLIDYLMRHRHSTPFEMCEIKLHIKLPIFVARQWIRHRTANVNEYSARYSILDREFYVPDREFLNMRKREATAEKKLGDLEEKGQLEMFSGVDLKSPSRKPAFTAGQSTTNRQGRDDVLFDSEAEFVLRTIHAESERGHTYYEKLLNRTAEGAVIDPTRHGLARELARMILPANTYTQWYWKIDLHNLLHFLSLRADPHAQYEIRAYAEVMLDIAKRWVPLAHEAFVKNRLDAVTLSAAALAAVKRMLAGETVTPESSGLGKREWGELMAALGRQA